MRTSFALSLTRRIFRFRFSEMLWELSGYSMSTPAMYRLFKLTAVSDKENTKRFSFSQASALAEHILRAVFHLTSDKVKLKTQKQGNPWNLSGIGVQAGPASKESISNIEPLNHRLNFPFRKLLLGFSTRSSG